MGETDLSLKVVPKIINNKNQKNNLKNLIKIRVKNRIILHLLLLIHLIVLNLHHLIEKMTNNKNKNKINRKKTINNLLLGSNLRLELELYPVLCIMANFIKLKE
jgi:hypothetical protein